MWQCECWSYCSEDEQRHPGTAAELLFGPAGAKKDTSTPPDHVFPFIQRVEISAASQARLHQRQRNLPAELSVDEVVRDKSWAAAPPQPLDLKLLFTRVDCTGKGLCCCLQQYAVVRCC